MQLNHVIEPQQFDLPMLEELFSRADEMEGIAASGGSQALQGKVQLQLFYEPSTRTRLSFAQAMRILGGKVESIEHAGMFSSAVKGETLEDTIRVLSGFGFHVIVIRHHIEGAATRAAEVSSVPVINAGDGPGYHPTQALLDLYTIRQECGRIDGLTVALVGDLRYGRAVRSLAYLLGKFAVKRLYFIAGAAIRIKHGILEYLERHRVPFVEAEDFTPAIMREVDVFYWTRLQKEREGAGSVEVETAYRRSVLTEDLVRLMKPDARVLHPLPRIDEIPKWFDEDPRAAYFRQSRRGLFVRMALLQDLLS